MSPAALGKGNLGQQQLWRQRGWTMFAQEKLWAAVLCQEICVLLILHDLNHNDGWTRCSLNQQGWAWLRAGRISGKQALTWRSRRQERLERMRRCSKKGREGLNPEQSGHIPHLQRSAHLQHLRGRKSRLEKGWTPGRESNRLCSSAGRIPGHRQEYWQAGKGRGTAFNLEMERKDESRTRQIYQLRWEKRWTKWLHLARQRGRWRN